SSKHDYLLVYSKDSSNYKFNVDDIERIPYMAPGLVTPEKESQGKLPTDTWFDRPQLEDVLKRIIKASTDPADIVLDCFASSTSVSTTASELKRRFILLCNDLSASVVFRHKYARDPLVQWLGELSSSHT
ncbi:MAG: DNA methyltransferase, partial [Anaerolineales bacterium]